MRSVKGVRGILLIVALLVISTTVGAPALYSSEKTSATELVVMTSNEGHDFPVIARNQDRTVGIFEVQYPDPGDGGEGGGYTSPCVYQTKCNFQDYKCEIGTTGCAWADTGKCKSCTWWPY